jgi:RPA family protein
MPEYQKRQIARKLLISELIVNKFIINEDGPNYIRVRGMNASRVNIMAIVISAENDANIKTILIDDGSGKIPLRIFDSISVLDDIQPGDPITVIGWIREYNNERYITPEIIKKLDNPKWLEVRKKEIEKVIPENSPIDEEIIEIESLAIDEIPEETIEEVENISKSDKIYELIKKIDEGDGAIIEDIIAQSEEPDAEKIINTLMKEGDIFEIRPGRFKVLE